MFRRSAPAVFVLLALCGALTVRAQQKLLTIEDIYDPAKRDNFDGKPAPNVVWLKDGAHYLQAMPGATAGTFQLMRVNAVTGEAAPFHDAERMEKALAALPGMKPEDARRLARLRSYSFDAAQSAALINHANDLFYYSFAEGRAARLTNDAAEESIEEFSPDGKLVSFVRGNNLYVVDVSGTGQARALTTDGSKQILNGILDWVYQEEIYGRGNFKAHWWSPDSTRIAYLRLDESPVKEFTVVDHIPTRQELEVTAYPKAGDPNPKVQLGVVSATGSATKWLDTSKYKDFDHLIVRVGWRPDGRRVVYQVQDREQLWLDLNYGTPEDGKSATLFRDQTKAWIEPADEGTFWLKDGTFLWLSDRNGRRHLYHHDTEGKLLRSVTQGPWEVRSVAGIDEARGFVYFTSSAQSPVADHPYRVKLDGTGLTRLSKTEGSHRVSFNPTHTHYVDYWSDVNTPTQTRLFTSDGAEARVIEANPVETLKQYKLGKPEFLQVKTRDGFVMEAMMIRPPDFDVSKKYPVLQFTYAGPQAQQVRNRWGGAAYMWHQMLAQKGYVIWIVDNRSASNKGAETAWPVHGNLGELELRDIEDALAWLKGQPYIDGSRIGIWGWSYGGYMTAYALTHSKSFKLGIAGAPVTDWSLYDTIYTERLMRTPQNNPEGYRKSSPLAAAKDLSGRLLLIHGTIDDNVHLQNTIKFAHELQRAGKQFDLMLYPKSRHGVSDPLLVKHMRQMMTDYIVNHL